MSGACCSRARGPTQLLKNCRFSSISETSETGASRIGRQPDEPVEGLFGRRVEQIDRRSSARRAGSRTAGGVRWASVVVRRTGQSACGQRLQGDGRLRVAAAPNEDAEAHDRGVADELRGTDPLRVRFGFQQLPEIIAEPDGGGAHRHRRIVTDSTSGTSSTPERSMSRRDGIIDGGFGNH